MTNGPIVKKRTPIIVGRNADLAAALGIIQDGGSIDVVGNRGSGRTAFLAALRSRLEDENWRVISINGIASLQQHPLAAMHLAGVGGPSGLRSVSTIQATATAFTELISRDKSVLFLDDWDDLDESSWGIVESVRRQTGLPIVISRLHGLRARHTPSGLNASAKDPSFVITLHPVRFEELEQALTLHLGGPIEAGTMSHLYAKSGGIVGLALTIADASVHDGRLESAEPGWTASLDLWSPKLRGILEALLENLSEEAVDALEIISLVGVADLDTIRKLISWATLELLEERAMIKIIPSASHQLVTVIPPVLVEFFLNQPLATRSIRLRELLVERLGVANPVNIMISRSASPERQISEDDALFARLLQERARTRNIVMHAEWVEGPNSSTASQYVRAMLQAGCSKDDIAEVFTQSSASQGIQSASAEFAVLRAEWRAIVGRDIDSALRELADAQSGLGDYARLLDAATVRIATMMRKVPSDFATRLEITDSLPEHVKNTLRETQLLVLISLGQFGHARRVFNLISEDHKNNAMTVANQLHGYLLLGEGQYDESMRWARRGFDEARGLLDPDATLIHGTLAALGLSTAGDYPRTETVLDTLFAMGEPSPLLAHTQLALLSIASVVSVRRGQLQVGDRYFATIGNLDLPAGPLPAQTRAWPSAQLTAFNGQPEDAAVELWEGGDHLWERGARFTACLAGLTSIEISSDETRSRVLRERIGELDSVYLNVHLRYIEARDQVSVDELIGITDLLISTGRPGLAFSALEQAGSHSEKREILPVLMRLMSVARLCSTRLARSIWTRLGFSPLPSR